MKRLSVLLLIPLLAVSAACGNHTVSQGEDLSSAVNGGAVTTTVTTTMPTRLPVGEITSVDVPADADAYSTDFRPGVPADMLFLNGEVWHATTLLTMIPPTGEPVTPCGVVIDREKTPAAEGECNAVSLVGVSVWQSNDRLFTAEDAYEEDGSPYRGTVYRLWQRGVAVCDGPLFDGTNVLRFEGALYRKVAKVTENGDGLAEVDAVTLPAVPAEKGFVFAGRIVAVGSCAAQIDYGSTIGGLGRELYASAEFPHLLLAGNETIGYWALSSSDNIQAVESVDALWSFAEM